MSWAYAYLNCSRCRGPFLFTMLWTSTDNNRLTDLTFARNTISASAGIGIAVIGGNDGADGNTAEVGIRDNTLTDNGLTILVIASFNSSNNRVVARLRGNTVEGGAEGIFVNGGNGGDGLSANNEVDVRLERNTVRSLDGTGINLFGAVGSFDELSDAVAH